MSDSASPPSPASNSTRGSVTNSTSLPELSESKAPAPFGDNKSNASKAPFGDNKSNASPPPSSPPPSPPPSSPPPSAPPPDNEPPPASPPPSSPPPSSPPPSSPSPSSPPPASSNNSPPPSSDDNNNNNGNNNNQPSQSPSPPPPPEKSGSPPSDGGGSKASPPTWSPPPPAGTPQTGAASPPPPAGVGGQSPPVNTTSNVLTPPTSSAESSPKSSSSGNTTSTTPTKSTSSSSSSSSSTAQHATIVGAAAAGALIIAFIAIFFVVRGRRKKRDAYSSHYMPPINNYSGNSGGYYYSHSGQMGQSGPVDPFYGSGQPSPMGNSYGSQRYGGPESGISSSKIHFSYEDLMEITNGFARENVIGEGGFGCVYKGKMSDGKLVAIKQLKAGSGQGEREFRAEVEIISRVHHRHLVSLVGYCISEQQRLLIYEFVPNNTLEHHLHRLPVLDWSKRVKIAIGSAKGLAYLHEDCHPKIIHRDIKSANILLDESFEAQVADFGLARLNDTTQTHVSTRVMGTFGYLAPEYASSGKLTDRSDVFSFGVVLLELITGRKPVDASQPLGDESLVEWARPLLVQALETGDISALVDPRLENRYVESEMFRMIEAAAACVRHSAPKRPRMVKVVRALDCEGDISDLSNGVKYGQSTIYDSGQYNQDIMKFRRMALGMDDSTEFSGDYTSREMSQGPPSGRQSRQVSKDFTSGDSETLAINQSRFKSQY